MAERYPYARWATDRVKQCSPEYQQEARNRYFSNSGKIQKYDDYLRYCRVFGYSPDSAPSGYWESKQKWWHTPTGLAVGFVGIWLWFLAMLLGGSATPRRKEW